MGTRIIFPEDEHEIDGQVVRKSYPELWIEDKKFRIKAINSFGDDMLHIEFVIKGSDIEFGGDKK